MTVKHEWTRRVLERWRELLIHYGVDDEGVEASSHAIITAYTAASRHYHNMRHVDDILQNLATFRKEANNINVLTFAAIYHDLIYNTRRKDNEEQSAVYAEQEMTGFSIPQDIIESTAAVIRATIHGNSTSDDPDISLFLDCDLIILGANKDLYKRYAEWIREEYRWVPGILYRRNRKRLLKQFLAREQIYNLPDIREKYEQQARDNMTQEIAVLSKRFF